MSNVIIEMFPADNGDSFLVRCQGKRPTNILIDLGYEETYREFIKPRLIELNKKGEILDLVILTHVDADHVEGAQFFFEENGYSSDPNIIRVNEVWHNSYRHLSISEEGRIINDKLSRKVLRKASSLPTKRAQREDTKVTIEHGVRIASLLYKYQYSWNGLFNGQAVSSNTEPIALNDEVKLRLLTPTSLQLNRLREHWITGLKKLFQGIVLADDKVLDDAIEFVSYFYPDLGVPNLSEKASASTGLVSLSEVPFREERSVINGSSITFILEFEGKRVLFLADTHPSVLKKELENRFPTEVYPLYFDAIKVSHHGSKANTSKELLKVIDSESYLISTNGSQHGHPHLEALARIVVRENERCSRTLYFNYETDASVKISQENWKREFNYSVVTAETNKSSIIII